MDGEPFYLVINNTLVRAILLRVGGNGSVYMLTDLLDNSNRAMKLVTATRHTFVTSGLLCDAAKQCIRDAFNWAHNIWFS